MADFPVRPESEVLAALNYRRDKIRKRKQDRPNLGELADPPPMKRCNGPCQTSKVHDEFDRDRSKPDGLKTWCKECRKAKAAGEGEDIIAQAVREMDMDLLSKLSGFGTGGTDMPHVVQAMEAIISRMGGIEGFANLFLAQFLAAAPGSQMREKMLSKMLHVIEVCSDDAKVSKPRELMSDEELTEATKRRMKNLGLYVEADDVRETA